MKYLLFPFQIVWRIWFYVLIFSTLVIISPFLFMFAYDIKYYPHFWKTIRIWSFFIIFAMGFRLKITREQTLNPTKNYMFCANHASLLDFWIMTVLSKNPIVFVGKKELTKLPIFGYFYKKVSILVDRNSMRSRSKVYKQAQEKLAHGMSIAIFPEGLVPEENIILAPFKNGAFNLAIEHQIPIVLQVYFDAKRLFSWNFFKGYPGTIRVKQLNFIETKGLQLKDSSQLKQQAFDLMYNELSNDTNYMKDTNS